MSTEARQPSVVHIVPHSDGVTRLVVIRRLDGLFSVVEEYFYQSLEDDGVTIIAQGWARRPPEGLFATSQLARDEAVRRVKCR